MTWYIPEDLALYNWSHDWRMPIFASILYTLIVTYLSHRNIRLAKKASTEITNSQTTTSPNESNGTTPIKRQESWSLFRIAVVAHNILLMLFSACVFCSIFPLLLADWRFRSPYDSFCDVGGLVYHNGVGFWTWVFYMSKYYELLDTAILLAKGRPSSLLQTYHHSGAIISMWLLIVTRTFAAWVFVLENSFIHTWMYLYYALTCFGYQPRWKRLMTNMQITQFIFGLLLALIYVSVPNCIPAQPYPKDFIGQAIGGYWSQFIALSFNFIYVVILVVLFTDFSRKTYSGPSSSKADTSSTTKKLD